MSHVKHVKAERIANTTSVFAPLQQYIIERTISVMDEIPQIEGFKYARGVYSAHERAQQFRQSLDSNEAPRMIFSTVGHILGTANQLANAIIENPSIFSPQFVQDIRTLTEPLQDVIMHSDHAGGNGLLPAIVQLNKKEKAQLIGSRKYPPVMSPQTYVSERDTHLQPFYNRLDQLSGQLDTIAKNISSTHPHASHDRALVNCLIDTINAAHDILEKTDQFALDELTQLHENRGAQRR